MAFLNGYVATLKSHTLVSDKGAIEFSLEELSYSLFLLVSIDLRDQFIIVKTKSSCLINF